MIEPAQRSRRNGPARRTGGGLFVLGLAAGLLAALLSERVVRLLLDRDLELVRSVRDLVREEYVSAVDSRKLIDDALDGMLSGLDRNSHYYGQEELEQLDRETSGEFRGIGVFFRPAELGQVLFAYPGSPADRAGLRVGDRILSVAGRSVGELGPGGLLSLLHRETQDLPLSVEGLDGERRELVLVPATVLDPTVRHVRMLDEERGIGYAAILAFSHRTPEEFGSALEALEQRGLRALVLDLRSNPGGILESAVRVANRFVSRGTIVVTRTRSGTQVTEARPEEARQEGLPLALLIDGRSASASEVLAAALEDHARAVLIGEPSFGKGTVQTLKRIGRDRAVVKLTTALYFSPSLRRIEPAGAAPENGGIAPDLCVPLGAAEREAVYDFLHTYSPPDSALEAIAAWEAREQVELIARPPPDRQLEAAVALLSGADLDLHVDALR